MSSRPPLTAIVITLNEEENIARCLNSLSWAEEVLVVDSGSTDKTRQIAASLGAKVLSHDWSGYGQQKNWAIAQAQHDWILSIDADEELSAEAKAEIESFLLRNASGPVWGATFARRTFYLGRWIMHGGWYPNILVRLAHRSHSQWSEPAVHEQWQVRGAVAHVKGDILHYTFKSVGEQVQTNVRFAKLGAAVAKERGEHGTLLKILLKPIGKFLETYLWKRGFLDGLPGLVISINAAHSIFMKYVELRFEENSNNRQ